MKTLGLVMAIVLGCSAGMAQADVVTGNLVNNGDFDTTLDPWYGGGPGSMEWTSGAPDGGGMQINGAWESIYATSYTFTSADIGKTFYFSFDAGSIDQTAAGGGLIARLSQHTQWRDKLTPAGGYEIAAEELNAGMATHRNLEFTVPNYITPGDTLDIWFDTYGDELTGANHVVIDNVSLTTSAIPEPCGITMLFIATITMCAYAWRKRR